MRILHRLGMTGAAVEGVFACHHRHVTGFDMQQLPSARVGWWVQGHARAKYYFGARFLYIVAGVFV